MSDTVLKTNTEKKVNYQFKIIDAMLMFCVLCGHLGIVENFVPWTELFSVYGFGIQLFIFVSGYFYNSKTDNSPLIFILKKIKKLLIPYLLWNLFYGLLCFALSKAGFTFAPAFSWQRVTYLPFTFGPEFYFNTPSWFIVPMLFTEIITVLERRLLVKFEGAKKDLFLLIFNFCIGMSAIYFARKGYSAGGWNEEWWRFIVRILFFVPYYMLGYFYKTYLEKYDTLSNFWYFMIVCSLGIVYILLNGHASSYFVIVMGGLENPVYPIITGLLGIAFYLRIARVLTPVIGKSRYINAIADNTFSIMMHHMLGFFLLSGLFLIISKFLPGYIKFDIEAFKSGSYYYMPRGRGFPLVYVLVGLIVPIYIGKGMRFVKRVLLNRKAFFLYK